MLITTDDDDDDDDVMSIISVLHVLTYNIDLDSCTYDSQCKLIDDDD